ncbi:lysine exporter LysO family protein [Pseudonocardia cypriaca]|uniref:lysine exporter LysO family protein n=1 Tax=Pseudonocardia cypriaca TaxID=882449 RepID=UPI001151F6A5|nr:lysine exporter LysO family protein [Pseudonocardia cypriaca]
MTTPNVQRLANRGLVMVAAITLSGTLIGGLAAGYFTNIGLSQQFANQRSAQIDDTRRGVYIDYLQVVQQAYLAGAGTVDEQQLRTKESVVLLIAGEEVRAVVPKLAESALNENGDIPAGQYESLRSDFIAASQRERADSVAVDLWPFW